MVRRRECKFCRGNKLKVRQFIGITSEQQEGFNLTDDVLKSGKIKLMNNFPMVIEQYCDSCGKVNDREASLEYLESSEILNEVNERINRLEDGEKQSIIEEVDRDIENNQCRIIRVN